MLKRIVTIQDISCFGKCSSTVALPLMQTKDRFDKRNKRLRLMMVYIHEHYAEKISVKDIAGTAFASERECFRLFQNMSVHTEGHLRTR